VLRNNATPVGIELMPMSKQGQRAVEEGNEDFTPAEQGSALAA
jgi:hypothetical protein